MQTKLTLRLESQLIAVAKAHAKAQGKSLSKVVADYFKQFTMNEGNENLSPVTQSLIGIIDVDKFSKNDYKKHLEDKYL